MESRLRFDDYKNRRVELQVQEAEAAEMEARIACSLVEKWGLVSGVPDGEDTSGRQRIRLMSPEEVVDRAIVTSDLLVKAFRERGWMHKLPTFAESDAFRDALPDDKS